ncbi:hypothetical protein [Streptomyces millisiae]|uniref:Uncharacterized protein n=1 Tax=Streptomyces millisiae TaxID=3075542 RepID=A0ABU2LPA0_9ACTN|nr:hypothetical protein [Streptomyces sp. DSM 44918]MDT0319417.1 hypothetical protein [Streptomyces sp. DSM 44918]
MSAYHEIFVHPGRPLERLVSDVSIACGTPLEPVEDESITHRANLGFAAVEVEPSHEFEEDRGLAFDRYDSLVTVRDFGKDMERQEAAARRIFEALASLRRYRLLLVHDVQRFIASAEPEGPDS